MREVGGVSTLRVLVAALLFGLGGAHVRVVCVVCVPKKQSCVFLRDPCDGDRARTPYVVEDVSFPFCVLGGDDDDPLCFLLWTLSPCVRVRVSCACAYQRVRTCLFTYGIWIHRRR